MRVLITDGKYADLDLERRLFAEAGAELVVAQCTTAREVIDAGRDADALLVQYAPVGREVLEALPEVRMVSRYGVGVDTVDLAAAEELGVWVANVPDYGVWEVASHAYAMALALVRHIPFLDRSVRSGNWSFYGTGELTRPSRLTFGIVGLGRIGSAVAAQAEALFGQVVACDPYLPEHAWPAGVERLDLKELAKRSDVVSLHVPLNAETRFLFGSEVIGLMPRGSYLVNTARGPIVDPEALYAALEEGHLAGAALDVLVQEPPSPDDPLLSHPRTLLTPHAAFYSIEGALELRRKAVENILEWEKVGRPLYPVVEGRSVR